MIIENPDVFKTWLTSILEPLCDADPAALAKYVYALVKKEKPISELRDVMVDQLDVFLQHETKPFVEMLFKSLESNEYLKPREGDNKPPTPPPEPEPEELKEVVENEVLVTNGNSSPVPEVAPRPVPVGPAPRRVVVTRAPPLKRTAPINEQTLVKVLPLTELLEEPVDQPPRRRDRRNDPLRDKDDRRRRRSRSPERRVRARREPRHPREFEHDRRRVVSRSPSPRRYRNRSPPPTDRLPSRSRSRSPLSMRDRELDKERDRLRVTRELERDRMSRDREHRDRLSRSRERERSRDRSRDRSRSVSPRDNRLDSNDAFKRRCRDFDEKGYCMRGDLCQWDHGADPVVLEDAALSSVLTMPHPVPEYNPLAPDIWMAAPGFPPYPPPPHHPHPPRELIPIPRVRHEVPVPGAPLAPLPPRHPPPSKKNFDYNRIGMRAPLPANAINCSLEVKKVPRGMNDITHLNNHFSKFGKIVNIQVCYEGDPEAALITFSNPTEANVAYKSTEAVLNNRFIKVFWHNPDVNKSKQENMAPSNQQTNKPAERPNSQHPMSHNKVFINKDNIKATADSKQLQTEKEQKEVANGTVEAKKEPTIQASKPAPLDKSKRAMEVYKRAQELLQKQLHQQKLLIEKLESGNVSGPRKAALMDAINSGQEGIEKLRKELVASNGTMKQMQINAKRPKTRDEAQKEILDTELDMFNRQQEGQDVTDLLKKVAELRRQMALNFPVHTNVRRPISARGGRFNPSMRFTRSTTHTPKTFSTSTSVDHRPKALLISGFETDELDALYAHFAQFGEVSSKEVELSVPQLVLQFKARANAEQAILHGKNYNDRTLSITWALSSKPAAASHETKRNGDFEDLREEPTASETPQRSDEEDDDEAQEARSWRR